VKFKATLILLGVFIVLLAAVLVFESKGRKESAAKEKESLLVDVVPADVRKVALKRPDGQIVLEKDDKGVWRLTAPIEAMADASEADGLVSSLAGLRPDRVVEKSAGDLRPYGFPRIEVSLWVKGKDAPVTVLIGMENPLDKSVFAKRADDPRLVLLPSTLTTTLEKKAFDLRDKTVFKFDPAEVKKVRVRAKEAAWEAAREAEGWSFTSPFRALPAKGKLDSLLDSLSNLRATEFVSETKAAADVKKLGLEKPEDEVTLSLPAAGKEIVFALHKDKDKSYAMASGTNKIVAFDGALLADLEKKPDDLRERKVADFSSWEADRVAVKVRGITVTAVKAKVKDEDKWILETAAKDAADATKVEAFLRRLEGLEATGFVDAPKGLAAYGLDTPAAEISVRTKDFDNKVKETVLLVGKEDAAKKEVFVKNAKLGYLFRIDASLLADLPKEPKDWRAAPEAPVEKKK